MTVPGFLAQTARAANSKAASEADELSSEPMAVAAFVGEEVATTKGALRREDPVPPPGQAHDVTR